MRFAGSAINAGLAIDHVSVERSLLGGEKDHQHGFPRVNPGRFIAPRASKVGVVLPAIGQKNDIVIGSGTRGPCHRPIAHLLNRPRSR
jgi:hypothetical protein